MPVRYPYTKIIFVPILLFFSLLGLSSKVTAESDKVPSWKRLESKYTIIQYQTDEDLEKFNSQLDFGDPGWSLQQLFSSDKPQTQFGIIRNKVDTIYTKVQKILDMRKKMKKVIINIYPDREHLDEAFLSIYHKENHIRAGYIYEFNTIYINANDLHEGILAHEIAHSVIDNYLLVRPPAATAEILARYVDNCF